jgi:hypothetical protein
LLSYGGETVRLLLRGPTANAACKALNLGKSSIEAMERPALHGLHGLERLTGGNDPELAFRLLDNLAHRATKQVSQLPCSFIGFLGNGYIQGSSHSNGVSLATIL